MQRGLYFDFWGTLWLPTPDDDTLQTIAMETSRLQICKNVYDARLLALRYKGAPAPGVCQILHDFHKICPLVVISHSPLMKLEYFLKGWGLWDYFTAVVSTHEQAITKEEAMQHTRQLHQIEPILYVGDSQGDAWMAKNCKVDYIHLGPSREYEAIFGFSGHESCYKSFLLAMPEIVKRTLLSVGDLKKQP